MVRTLFLLVFCCVGVTLSSRGQSSIPRDVRGTEDAIARGLLNGNLIETNFRNHGELSRWEDSPWGIWPKDTGGRHIDGIGFMVSAQVRGEREKWGAFYPGMPDTTLSPAIRTYRDVGTPLGPDGEIWGWLPLPGFHNAERRNPIWGGVDPVPAMSDDANSWPDVWPDRLADRTDPGWPGRWNGLTGKGKMVADQESYYVMDDHANRAYQLDPETGRPLSPYGVFYPDPSDSTVGGLGLQVAVRTLQWSAPAAGDIMFLHHRITNVGATDYDALYVSTLVDYGMGLEEGDEVIRFDPGEAVAFGWDLDGVGRHQTGGSYTLGYTGMAVLEATSRFIDGRDNDGDGAVDEDRFSGPGIRIDGQDAIRAFVAQAYDQAAFEARYGPLEQRPAFLAGRWWTGDEDLDWRGFGDTDGNGRHDAGEPLYDDVGRDGLGPGEAGYIGPDEGEADGVPTPGEPNIDEQDAAEAEQRGITGVDLNERAFYENGENLYDDAWLWERIQQSQFPDGIGTAITIENIEPFVLLSTGPVALAPNTSTFYVTAWIFGEDEADFMVNRRLVQRIYDSDFREARTKPARIDALRDEEGIHVTWDSLSSISTLFSSFEGFRLYRSMDGRTFDKIGQWDLVNGVVGVFELPSGQYFDLGTDSGFEAVRDERRSDDFFTLFTYTDTDVDDDQRYLYAVTGYDRGVFNADSSGFESYPTAESFYVNLYPDGEIRSTTDNIVIVEPLARTATEQPGAMPEGVVLRQNYPNPFNPVTTIAFDLPRRADATLTIYDVTGRLVASLLDATLTAGTHRVAWDARGVSSGVYFYRLTVAGVPYTKQFVLVK